MGERSGRCLDSGQILKMELTEFTDGLDVEYEKKRNRLASR